MSSVAQRSVRIQLRNLREASPALQDKRLLGARLAEMLRANILFLLVFVLPSILGTFYYLFVAAGLYVSEAKYVVRTPSDSRGNQLGSIMQTTGISKATDDAHAINAYFLSRDAMELLRREVDLDAVYASPKADIFSRFPGPLQKWRAEFMFQFYLSMTQVKYDKSTGITVLSVWAFDPADAQKIAKRLMTAGEEMANRLTQRMRENLVRGSAKEAEEARLRALDVQNRLTVWRNEERQIDPTRYSYAVIEVIARLSLELALMRGQLQEIQRSSPLNPNVGILQNRVASLEQQIDNERRALAGSGATLAPKIVEYELLQLERMFAEKLFAAAATSQEAARSEAQRQQIYVERVVEPPLPDYPSRPYRLLSSLALIAISFLVYLIAKKVLTNISRHGAFARYFRAKTDDA
ncbi:MAG: hypothetical protein IOC52_05745 [Methylobacterium sp.]|nr:hypothetical protein [Methylobacterium sp.]